MMKTDPAGPTELIPFMVLDNVAKTHRMDEHCLTYLAYEGNRVSSVFRGFKNLSAAKAYATRCALFFAQQGLARSQACVYVVRGPTSTTPQPFEVVTARCGYTVEWRTP